MRGLALLLALGGFGLLTACDDESTTTADGGGGAPPQGETYAAGMAKATDAVTVVLVEAVPGPPIRGDSNVWTLALQDAEGAPMDGCTIEVDPRMPAHGHGTTPVPVATPIEGETGMFEVRPLNLFMPGLWRVAVRPTCGSDTAEVFFEFWIELSMHPIAPSAWPLDPELTFLNHGSFGACPHEVLAAQQALRARIERQPVQFYVRELLDLIDAARERVAAFLGADPAGLVFVRNATSGVNAVLRSLNFNAGDEILVTDHGYAACEYAARFVAQRAGARVVVARLPFPGLTPDAVLDAVLDAVTPRTRLAMLDHITSPTGVVLPIARLIDALRARGVDTLVDGAHGPGMLPLDLNALGAAWYTANLHKWVCAPKGAAVLVVRPDHRAGLHPAVISHGHRFPLTPGGRSRLHWEFDWPGTDDPTPWLCAPVALDFFARQPGGWAAVQARGRKLALAGREAICAALGVEPPCPPEMIGTLAAIPLPDAPTDEPPPDSPLYTSPLQQYLLDKHRIEVPIVPWPAHPQRLVRFSAAPYNVLAEYERLTAALREAL